MTLIARTAQALSDVFALWMTSRLCARFAIPFGAWAPIVVLFNAGAPDAVRRRVWAIVVDALDCHRWMRTRTHIGIELQEVVEPCIAHSDTSAPVALIANVRLSIAPRLHCLPDVELRDVRKAVRCVRAFAAFTAAALNLTKVVTALSGCRAAIAPTQPSDARDFRRIDTFQNQQPAEALAG